MFGRPRRINILGNLRKAGTKITVDEIELGFNKQSKIESFPHASGVHPVVITYQQTNVEQTATTFSKTAQDSGGFTLSLEASGKVGIPLLAKGSLYDKVLCQRMPALHLTRDTSFQQHSWNGRSISPYRYETRRHIKDYREDKLQYTEFT